MSKNKMNQKPQMKPQSEMRIEPISEVMDKETPDHEPMPHEVESAMGDMQRAEEHKKNPHMMQAIHKAAGNKMMSLKALKNLAGKKAMEGK